MCKGNCSTNPILGNDAPTDANVPHTRIPLAHYAELNETADRLYASLDTATAKVKAYKAALERIAELCIDTDRLYIGNIARDVLYPPITPKAKLGQESK